MNETRRLRGDGLGAHTDRDRGRSRLFAVHPALPAEDAALVDDQRADHDVAEDFAGGKDLQATRGVHVALNAASDDAVSTADVALDPAPLSHSKAAFRLHITEHFTFNP